MKTSSKFLVAASVLALGLAANATDSNAAKKDMEKCYGVVKAGKNDCGAKGHSCAAQATEDSAKGEWIFVPTGLCDKLTNGSTTAG